MESMRASMNRFAVLHPAVIFAAKCTIALGLAVSAFALLASVTGADSYVCHFEVGRSISG